MSSPAELRAIASGLSTQAASLPTALDAVAAHAGPDAWRGPASERFVSELEEQRRRLRALADELRMAARMCTADADALDTEPASFHPPARFA